MKILVILTLLPIFFNYAKSIPVEPGIFQAMNPLTNGTDPLYPAFGPALGGMQAAMGQGMQGMQTTMGRGVEGMQTAVGQGMQGFQAMMGQGADIWGRMAQGFGGLVPQNKTLGFK